MPAIKLRKISKAYENNLIFTELDLEIKENEFFVLVGPSGSGKSTLLRVIAGLEASTSGKIFILDQEVTNISPQKRNLAMVFQNYALFPHLTVKENILFGLSDKKISYREQEERLNKALEMTDLEKYVERKPSQLSGGQRQRVALARAIASSQPLILMDEPLSNLDAKLRETMRTQIKQLQRELKTTIIYVTHDQTEAMTMGDRIALLNDGQIQQIGQPLELYNEPKNTFVASFIGTPKINFFNLSKVGNYYHNKDKSVKIPTVRGIDANEIIVGVRPEHLEITDEKGIAQISAKIFNVEQLGDETIITATVLDEKIRIKANGQLNFELNQVVNFKVDEKHLYYFDAITQERFRN